MSNTPDGSKSHSGEMSPEELQEFRRRADALGQKIDTADATRQAEIEALQDKVMRSRGMAYGLRMSSELVAAILVGAGFGYLLDKMLGTTPWLMLLFFFLGFAAGILNVMRAFKQMQGEIAHQTKGDIGQDIKAGDDDD